MSAFADRLARWRRLDATGTHLLHGASVAFGERAVCLVGESGVGKSTLAASLVRVGGKYGSDGAVPIRISKSVPWVLGAPFPLRATPESAGALGLEGPVGFAGKHDVSLAHGFCRRQLGWVLELNAGDRWQWQPVRGAAAAELLLRNQYFDRASSELDRFRRVIELANRVSIATLSVPHNYVELGRGVALVTSYVAAA